MSGPAIHRVSDKDRHLRVAIDDVSKSIIEQLQIDGRKSYSAIGNVVGLSEAAVRQRVQRLRMAMLGMKVDGDLQKVADPLASFPEIDYVVVTAGSFDVMAEVICEDDDHMLELLQRIRNIPTVRSTESFVYLKLRKQLYNWGTR
jgi:Lrp/AsnC family transcriptional regulator for asnA, asnC and gidA